MESSREEEEDRQNDDLDLQEPPDATVNFLEGEAGRDAFQNKGVQADWWRDQADFQRFCHQDADPNRIKPQLDQVVAGRLEPSRT